MQEACKFDNNYVDDLATLYNPTLTQFVTNYLIYMWLVRNVELKPTEASACINSTSSKHYILHPHLNSPLKHEFNNYYKRLK